MSSHLEMVRLTRGPRDVARFLRVPHAIYRNDPQWVAPLEMDMKLVFQDRNPLFEHADMDLWVARRDGRDVGRIAAIQDRFFNKRQSPDTGFFGFFESIEDGRVAEALFETVIQWTLARGLRRLLGPFNPTSNDECGLLVDGFDRPPVFMMPYNPRYYVPLLEGVGLRKAKDLIAFEINLSRSPMDRFEKVSSRFRKHDQGITFRPVRKRTLLDDLAQVKQVYNEAWEDNWGFVPMTDREIDFLAHRIKPLLLEGLVWLAEVGNEPIGFLLAVPDFNEALQPMKGKLLRPGLFRFLSYLFGWRVPAGVRVMVLGVREKYRGRGIESVMLTEGLKTGFRAGFTFAEASWILEENVKVRRVIEWFGGKPYKTYRLYEKELG